MVDLEEILNPSGEEREERKEQVAAEEAAVEPGQAEATEETGADESSTADVVADTADQHGKEQKSELSALAKERERVRRKEAELDAELERLRSAAHANSDAEPDATRTAEEQKSTSSQPTLKDLRKQYREAMLEGDDEAMERLEEQIDTKIVETALERQSTMSVQQKEQVDFNDVFKSVHDEFPFLEPTHEKANAELNENINSFMAGRIAQGDSRTVALKKAVNVFAPAYAKSIGSEPEEQHQQKEEKKPVDERLKRQGFSEVRSASNKATKPFTEIVPLDDIFGKK